MKKNKASESRVKRMEVSRSRKAIESSATFGLILVAAGMLGPFADLANPEWVRVFKWIYASGALIFTIARIVGSTDPQESLRVRRLRRLEFWAGVAFCIGVFFWFYNENRYAGYLDMGFGTLACVRDTIYFTLAGAIIQIVAAFSITRRLKKEQEGK